NKYIMLMVEIDSNAVLVEPMSSRSEKEMQRAYLSSSPAALPRETCQLVLVPPYCHVATSPRPRSRTSSHTSSPSSLVSTPTFLSIFGTSCSLGPRSNSTSSPINPA
ncbi:hypothetical protein THAOC_23834, partial [Thalassiosira oceanica]